MSSQPPDPVVRGQAPDAAGAALANALAVSFRLLKAVMVLLLLALLFSGVFRVQDNQVAIVLRLGAPVGGETPTLYTAGLHQAFLRPVDQQIFVPAPTADQTLTLESFWPALSAADRAKPLSEVAPPVEGLRPGLDGALLTADQNLVHIKLAVTYRILRADQYVAALYDDPSTPNDQEAPEKALLAGLIETAAVQAAAVRTADQIARSQGGLEDLIKQNAYAQLARLKLENAIEITEVRIPEKAVPLQVRSAFEDVTKAENERREAIDKARREANETLIGAAGAEYQALVEAIRRYSAQADRGEPTSTREVDELLAKASGKVAELLTRARTEATETVSEVSNRARVFSELLPEYRRNPQIVRQWLWSDMVQSVLGDARVEKTFVDPTQPATLRLQGRDPTVAQQRELESYQERTGRK